MDERGRKLQTCIIRQLSPLRLRPFPCCRLPEKRRSLGSFPGLLLEVLPEQQGSWGPGVWGCALPEGMMRSFFTHL